MHVWEDEQKAYVVFEDGSEHRADLVLAADGIRSRIRDIILSDNSQSRIVPHISEWTSYIVKVSEFVPGGIWLEHSVNLSEYTASVLATHTVSCPARRSSSVSRCPWSSGAAGT